MKEIIFVAQSFMFPFFLWKTAKPGQQLCEKYNFSIEWNGKAIKKLLTLIQL